MMDQTYDWEELKWKTKAIAVICPSSFLFFFLVKRLVKAYGIPRACAAIPDRWSNYATSCFHALVCGVAALAIVLTGDGWMESSPQSFYLHCVAAGYFAYDTLDMWISDEPIGSTDMYAHHVLIFFFITITQLPPCGRINVYCAIDYLSELSNVFLHARKLLSLLGKRGTAVYLNINILYFVSFFVFRFIPQMLMFAMMHVDLWNSKLSLFCYLIVIPQQSLLVIIGSHVAYKITMRTIGGKHAARKPTGVSRDGDPSVEKQE
ncbi:TLC domain-containing protein 2 [Lingula anatina]|uniref:TLC domain-containing protein 2 n=1 Tax=Lingula anatina TaxID=7574 RepID=A0A1S3JKS0_LINAN|nr:TLC domain-containing protein 2 [Lingula anatina]|eukprot:XP_013411015.1 TLC domain-containing protein 2 [Lingula anatina]